MNDTHARLNLKLFSLECGNEDIHKYKYSRTMSYLHSHVTRFLFSTVLFTDEIDYLIRSNVFLFVVTFFGSDICSSPSIFLLWIA